MYLPELHLNGHLILWPTEILFLPPKLKVSPIKMSSRVTLHERGRLRNSLSRCCPKALSTLSARLWGKEDETEEKGLELSKLNIAGGDSLLSEL